MANIKRKTFSVIGTLLFLTLFFWFAKAAPSPDAIGIRVVPNPKHLSALRWYQSQKFTGSPQAMIVDGYSAIREGRTVYVDASNIKDNDNNQLLSTGDTLYTNIFVISYNQNAEKATEDIFGQILANWKFNSNIMQPGQCIANVPMSTNCQDAVNCWHLDSSLVDSGTNKLNLSPGAGIAYTTGKNAAPIFNGKNYLEIKDNLKLRMNDRMTLVADIFPTAPSPAGGIIINKEGEYEVARYPDGTIRWAFANQAITWTWINTGYVAPLNRWTNIVIAYGNNVVSTYANGVLVHQLPYAGSNVLGDFHPDANDFYIGYREKGYEQTMIGMIDEVKIYDRVLSPTEVAENFTPTCILDSACGSIGHCVSSKSVAVRDVKRLADLNDLNRLLDQYKAKNNGLCPTLKSGSYMPNKSISTWPSWQETLGKALSTSLPLDPVNNLGSCLGYNSTTCWDELNRLFADPTPLNDSFDLPNGSLAYVYLSSPDGRSCGFFAAMESGLVCDSAGVCTVGNNLGIPTPFNIASSSIISASLTNAPPVVVCGSLYGNPTQQFRGYVSAVDPEGDNLSNLSSWQIDTTVTGAWPNWVGGPVLRNSVAATPQTKQIFATTAGNEGVYNVRVTVADSKGATGTAMCHIYLGGYCGDGIRQTALSEQCDDGNISSTDACYNCMWVPTTLGSVNLSGGYADATVFDNNNNPNTATDTPMGTFLKLSGTQKTPYFWIALTSEGKVIKIRTYTGPRRNCVRNGTTIDCSWDMASIENIGQTLGKYPSGFTIDNPSRVAVNAETGDVWVHDRHMQEVYKLDINGAFLKKCKIDPTFTQSDDPALCSTFPTPCAGAVLGSPTYFGNGGGLAIAKNGDVWAGNYFTGKVARINGDDSNCNILETVPVGGNPYGLAIDSDGNVWAKGGALGVVRINTHISGPSTIDNFPVSFYGMTVDSDDNPWFSSTGGVQSMPKGSASGTSATFHASVPATMPWSTGMTIDSAGDIWNSVYSGNQTQKFLKNGAFSFSVPSGGTTPHGICGDSEGHVWESHYSGLVRAFNLDGTIAADVCVNGGVAPACNPGFMYTYSDMTGLNRAMVLRSGTWLLDPPLNGGFDDLHWGRVAYTEIIPPGSNTSIEVSVRASNDSTFSGVSLQPLAAWNGLALTDAVRSGRYLQIKAIMRSGDKGVTPVLTDLRVVYP
ncbi:hypothetical protein HGA64_03505 [Candidatus Falkowbacteria bacterium]|nr:hypothetical protein [Candidatus Falkowbacteria bacterium]